MGDRRLRRAARPAWGGASIPSCRLLLRHLRHPAKDEAIAAIKHAVDKTYGRKSKRLVELNYRAIDTTLAECIRSD